jgi:hypothetical protein
MGSMDETFGEGISRLPMDVLAQRILQLNKTAKMEQWLSRRPILPTVSPNQLLDEVKLDHDLLCRWHESAWQEQQAQQQQQQQQSLAPNQQQPEF